MINSSIGAGFFGIKRDEMLTPRITTFAKFLRYLILSQNEFLFGVDEIFLKFILSLNVEVCLLKKWIMAILK